jgi:hypothetical protein
MKKIVFAALLAVASFASATTITFDNFTGFQDVGTQGGVTFNSFTSLDTTTYNTSGYTNGVVSLNNVAFTYGDDGSVTSASPFTFNSVYLTSAWNHDEIVDIVGSLNGQQLFSRSLILDVYAPTLETFNWAGIDTVTFSVHGGTQSEYSGGGSFLAYDNFRINEATSAIPEPSSIALLGLGLFGFAASRSRKAAK